MKPFIMVIVLVFLSLLIVYCNSKPTKNVETVSFSATEEKKVNTMPEQTADKAARTSNDAKAPDFEAINLMTGEKFRLSDYKGKVIILDFWATWCPPCKAEIPFFIELVNQYGNQGLIIIGAALDDPEKVKNFYENKKMNYPVFLASQQLASDYGGIQGIPTTFIIDKEGYIKNTFVGYRTKQVFEEAFQNYK